MVTRVPVSLMAKIPEDWFAPTFGSVKVVVVPSPVALELAAAGKNAVTTSVSPVNRLPALATKTRVRFGRIAACVGLTPMLATPMSVSPETSI